eukprot:766852-Lingulodinium_polyedra.AAC.1
MLLAFAERWPATPQGPFEPSTYGRMRRWLPRATGLVGLGDVAWTTHSLRRGGATALYESGWAFEDVQLFGRWAAASSC